MKKMRNFGGVIWTDHALARMHERGIKQEDALAAWNNPDRKRPGTNKNGTTVYYKNYGNQKMEVVSKKNDKGEWVILSVWSRPRFRGAPEQSYITGSKRWNNILEKGLNTLLGWARRK